MEQQTFFSRQYARLLMALMIACFALAALAFAHATFKQAENNWGPTTISVSGEGEVMAKPDIGSFSFSVTAKADDAAQAQEQSAEAIDAILSYLKDAGVEEKDLKTNNYWLNPTYQYEETSCLSGFCPAERTISGYEVSQNVTVKVRDLDRAGDLISGAGEKGATNISSLSFTIDDEKIYKAEARKEAIVDAKAKAEVLADDLGVRIVKMTGYWESDGGYGGYNDYGFAETRAFSLDSEASFAPELPVGENIISSQVEMTFEVK